VGFYNNHNHKKHNSDDNDKSGWPTMSESVPGLSSGEEAYGADSDAWRAAGTSKRHSWGDGPFARR